MTTDIRPIVVGIDESEAAEHALGWAIDEAVIRHCPVHAVTVWTVAPATDFVWTQSDEIREVAAKRLSNTVRLTVEGRKHVPTIVECVVEGSPAPALVEAAQHAAMLVVATHRGERLRKAMIGSVSAACVRQATVPVVVVRPEGGDHASA